MRSTANPLAHSCAGLTSLLCSNCIQKCSCLGTCPNTTVGYQRDIQLPWDNPDLILAGLSAWRCWRSARGFFNGWRALFQRVDGEGWDLDWLTVKPIWFQPANLKTRQFESLGFLRPAIRKFAEMIKSWWSQNYPNLAVAEFHQQQQENKKQV